MWYFDEPNEKYAHTIIPTAQRPPEAKRRWWEFSPNALVAVTERDATGALKTTFRDQNVSIIASMPENPQNNIKLYLLDGVLKLPPTYKEFLKSNRDARIFQELRDAASSGGVELETSTGFTAFIPIHQPPQLLQKARKLFPTQASLSVFYSNHVRYSCLELPNALMCLYVDYCQPHYLVHRLQERVLEVGSALSLCIRQA